MYTELLTRYTIYEALAVSHIRSQSFSNTLTDSDDNLVVRRLRKHRSKVLRPQLLLELIRKTTLT
jgi:hypothetical protein